MMTMIIASIWCLLDIALGSYCICDNAHPLSSPATVFVVANILFSGMVAQVIVETKTNRNGYELRPTLTPIVITIWFLLNFGLSIYCVSDLKHPLSIYLRVFMSINIGITSFVFTKCTYRQRIR